MSREEIQIAISHDETNQLLRAFPEGLVAFDLETTGLSPASDRIIEIAAIKIDSEGNLSTYHQIINPMIMIPEKTIQYHQITDDMVQGKPSLKKPLKEFLDFIGNYPLVAHNAQFDIGFIVMGIHEYKYGFSLSDVFDSCKLARTIHRDLEEKPEDFKLSTLAEFFKIKFTHHRALDDALVCLRVFAHSIMKMPQVSLLDTIKEKSFLYKLSTFKSNIDLKLPKKFDLVVQAMQNDEHLEIIYSGGTHKDVTRPIRPIAFLPVPAGLILFAECQIDNMNKSFALKKIKKVSILTDK